MDADFLNNSNSKSDQLKRRILLRYTMCGGESIADLSHELGLSIPTVTKAVTELIKADFVCELGRQGPTGGRRPCIYGLNPSVGYFVGVNIKRKELDMCLTNFRGDILLSKQYKYDFENTPQALDEMCNRINSFITFSKVKRKSLFSIGINIPGRVNPETGYSYSYFFFDEKPLSMVLEERLGCPVCIENDSRAMAYGEYMYGVGNNEQNMIFLNISWGFGIGMILDRKLYYGKSGFSGEYGHFPFFDNEVICRCGKRGCLETEVSGWAVHRHFIEKLKQGHTSTLSKRYHDQEQITLHDILDALESEDVLAIEVMEEVGQELGRAIAGLINMFNPEVIVLGGLLSSAQNYLLLPLKTAINKYSLNLVCKDTTIKVSKLQETAGLVGICAIARNKILGL